MKLLEVKRVFDLNKYMYSPESIGRSDEVKFTAEELAVIIAMSNKCSLEEKMRDLQNLISDCTDNAICSDIELLIQLWKEILVDSNNNSDVVFLANLQERGAESDRLSAYRFFASYEAALNFLQKEKSCLRDKDTYGEIWRMELDTDNPDCDIYYFGNDMKLSNIVCCSTRPLLEDMKLLRYMRYIPNADMDYSIKEELKKMVYR